MRFVVLILLFQFANPAFAQVNENEGANEKSTYSKYHQDFHVCLTALRKDSEETDDVDHKSTLPTAELIDFSVLKTVLTQYHSHIQCDPNPAPLTHEQHFKLNCSFLI